MGIAVPVGDPSQLLTPILNSDSRSSKAGGLAVGLGLIYKADIDDDRNIAIVNDANVAGLSRRWQDAAIGARAMTTKETQAQPTPREELNPASVFAHPMQVVHAKDLTIAEKRAILRSWETDARALQRAEDEGMQVGQRSRLHDVEIALACLDAKAG